MKTTSTLFRLAATALLAAALFGSACRAEPEILVYVRPGEIVKSNFDFHYEHWQEEKLALLRGQEDFTEISAEDQFSYFRKLTEWTHRQWDWSRPDPYPPANALDILAEIRAGNTGGFCGQYAYVLADVLKSLGYFSVRYLELWSNEGQSHFCIEAWSDQFEKWVVLDPDQALFFEIESSGLPANALEVRTSLFDPGFRVTEKAVSPDTPIQKRVSRKVYANFAVSLRSDLLRSLRPPTVGDRLASFLFWQDEQTSPESFRQFGGRIPYRNRSSRYADLYFDCNRVRVEYRLKRKDKLLLLEFFTDGSMANFSHFIVSTDRGASWRKNPGQFQTELVSGRKLEIMAAPVNALDRPGVITRIEARLD